ncbi:MAG: PD-(D/E)XK nuclease family protein [Elainellaceae cyanobacterium]
MTRPLLRLSQAQLNLLERCPRKFQYTYLEQVLAPASPEETERQLWGSQFHLRMQQHELGVLHRSERESDDVFQIAAEALVAALPEIFGGDQDGDRPQKPRHSEHRRSLSVEGYLLTVVYDLVVLGDQQAQIFDWKTYRKPQRRGWLEESWQTRLYPFVLAETTDYEPEDISMTYWFINPRQIEHQRSQQLGENDEAQSESAELIAPESITFPYSTFQHQATRQELQALLTALTQYLDLGDTGYAQASQRQANSGAAPYLFPQIPEQGEVCPTCPYALRCGRSPHPSHRNWFDIAELLDIEPIEEISL